MEKTFWLRCEQVGTSLAVGWLRLRTLNAGGKGSVPGLGTKIPRAAQRGQKKNVNKYGAQDFVLIYIILDK